MLCSRRQSVPHNVATVINCLAFSDLACPECRLLLLRLVPPLPGSQSPLPSCQGSAATWSCYQPARALLSFPTLSAHAALSPRTLAAEQLSAAYSSALAGPPAALPFAAAPAAAVAAFAAA